MTDEIYQVQPLLGTSLEQLNRMIEELNMRLLSISQRLHDQARFVYRENLENDDFGLSDFTTDGNWHDLDLSSILPAEAKLAIIYLHVNDNAAGNNFEIKAYDDTTDINTLEVTSEVANLDNDAEGVLVVQNYRRLKYKGTNTTFTNIRLIVRGYWIW